MKFAIGNFAALTFGALVPSIAHAAPVCGPDGNDRDVDEQIFLAIEGGEDDWEWIIPSTEDYFLWGDLDTWDEDGRETPREYSRPYGMHMMASVLARFGVGGQHPSVIQKTFPIIGDAYVYDENGIYLSKNFDRSLDEYGKLIRSREQQACQLVDLGTGEKSCARYNPFEWEAGRQAIDPTYRSDYVTWGKSTVTLLVSQINEHNWFNPAPPEDPYPDAQHLVLWDIGIGYRRSIQYKCDVFDNRLGSIYAAQIMVHEAFHKIGKGHVDSTGECDRGDGACEAFVDDVPRSPLEWEQLASTTQLGSYQVDHRFLCDLASTPNEWVPIMASQVAAAAAQNREDSGPFTNYPEGRPPYSCAPTGMDFRVVLDEDTCLGGQPICESSGDCDGLRICIDGCCQVDDRPK